MFTLIDSSLYGFITNKHDDQLPVGSLAQLVEHCTIYNWLISILSLCKIWKVKSTNIYAWPCGLIIISSLDRGSKRSGSSPGTDHCSYPNKTLFLSLLSESWMKVSFWENSLHLTRKSGRILSIEKQTHLIRVKFKENSERPGSYFE